MSLQEENTPIIWGRLRITRPLHYRLRNSPLPKSRKKYEVLIREEKCDTHFIIAAADTKELFDTLKTMNPNLIKKNFVKVPTTPAIEKELEDFEKKQVLNEFKFGVLYYKDGQTEDDQMFNNCYDDASDEYKEFLEVLGEKVMLKGWPSFNADLDVKENLTGTHSIFTQWNDYEVMYHVSTLITYNPRDPQQIEKKRFLGNDIVVIIYHDGNTPFDPACIHSDYNQVFIVIREDKENELDLNSCSIDEKRCSNDPDETKNRKKKYRIGIVSKQEVTDYEPDLPDPPIFDRDTNFKNFLISECITAVRCVLKSPRTAFQKKVAGFRGILLSDIYEKFVKPASDQHS